MPDERDRVERDLSSKRQSTKRTEPKSVVEIEAEQPLLSEDGQTGTICVKFLLVHKKKRKKLQIS